MTGHRCKWFHVRHCHHSLEGIVYSATELPNRLLFRVLRSCRESSSEIGVAATALAHKKSVRGRDGNISTAQIVEINVIQAMK